MAVFYENKDNVEILVRYGSYLNFAAHLHNHIELIFMLEGETKTTVDGQEELLRKGDVFITFPNQVHQYISHGPEKYLILIFSPDLLKEMKYIFYKYMPVNQVVRHASQNPAMFSYLERVYEASLTDFEYKDIQIKGNLLAFFGELLKVLPLQPIKNSNLTILQNVLNFCSQSYMNNVSLDGMADTLKVSKYYLSHLLKKKIGIGFSDYINALRISEACNHLMEGEKNITDIAYLVGFNTIRTFNRAFVKQVGMTPSEFKKGK